MPKIKTHKATAKRVKITGSGKVLRETAAKSHLLTNKSPRKNVDFEIDRSDIRKIKRLLAGRKK